MTDRHAGFIVTLGSDLREDDAEATVAAMRQLRGVVSVEPVVSDIALHIAEQRVRLDLGKKLWAVLHPPST